MELHAKTSSLWRKIWRIALDGRPASPCTGHCRGCQGCPGKAAPAKSAD